MSYSKFDIVVIGGGPAGYVAALRAAQLGFKTACVEKEQTLGGTCLNVGCIPSKALLQSTETYEYLKEEGKAIGVIVGQLDYDFNQMMTRKADIVKGLVDSIASLFKRGGVERIQGEASFLTPHSIQVTNGQEKITVESERFIIATGSEPIPLPFLPFDEKRVVSSTGALSLQTVPKKMLVVGAGVIGLELASVFRRLGSEIVIVEMLDQICPGIDLALCKAFQRILTKKGITFYLGSKVVSGSVGDNGVVLKVLQGDQEHHFDADVVLVAIGRRPYSKGLNLESIGVKLNNRGQVIVDGAFRTSVPNILAVGDVIDGPMLAHKASEEGVAAVEILAGLKPKIDYVTIPNVVYTHPEIASTGLTEKEALDAGLKVVIGTSFFKGNARARCSNDTEGFVKVIGDETTGKLLGIHILGPHASEMIGEGVVALQNRMTLEQLAHASHAHPTLSEAIKEAVLTALGSSAP